MLNKRERDSLEGDWFTCPHCEGTGKQDGPGGKEECCHCRGVGEVWLEDSDQLNGEP